jgi:excisionase family DNA binding protein
MSQLLTLEETAKRLGCAVSTLPNKQYRDKHGIRAVRLGKLLRFDEADLQSIISRNKQTIKE